MNKMNLPKEVLKSLLRILFGQNFTKIKLYLQNVDTFIQGLQSSKFDSRKIAAITNNKYWIFLEKICSNLIFQPATPENIKRSLLNLYLMHYVPTSQDLLRIDQSKSNFRTYTSLVKELNSVYSLDKNKFRTLKINGDSSSSKSKKKILPATKKQPNTSVYAHRNLPDNALLSTTPRKSASNPILSLDLRRSLVKQLKTSCITGVNRLSAYGFYSGIATEYVSSSLAPLKSFSPLHGSNNINIGKAEPLGLSHQPPELLHFYDVVSKTDYKLSDSKKEICLADQNSSIGTEEQWRKNPANFNSTSNPTKFIGTPGNYSHINSSDKAAMVVETSANKNINATINTPENTKNFISFTSVAITPTTREVTPSNVIAGSEFFTPFQNNYVDAISPIAHISSSGFFNISELNNVMLFPNLKRPENSDGHQVPQKQESSNTVAE